MRNKFPLFGNDSTGRNRTSGAPKMGDYGNSRANDPFAAVAPVSPEMFEEARSKYEFAVPVMFPRTTQAPEGARTIDLRRLISVPDGSSELDLLGFVCLPAATTVFYFYSLVLPAGGFPGVQWHPVIDEQRVLQYHGDPGTVVSPNPPTGLNVATASDFSDNGLVRCQILMQPNQTFRWKVSNTSGGAVQMGVRLVGYMDLSQQLLSSKFGD